MSHDTSDTKSGPGAELLFGFFQDQGDIARTVTGVFCGILLIVAGNDTTTSLIGNGAVLLAQHPEQRRLLAQDPAVVRIWDDHRLSLAAAVATVRDEFASASYAGSDGTAPATVVAAVERLLA